jgi:uncharacterized protein (DUF1684 family)
VLLDELARDAEESRERYRAWLAGPESFLAAVARYELPVGETVRFGKDADVPLDAATRVTIEATDDGFVVDGFRRGPGLVHVGRYRLRLSHQNAPAVVILDPDAPRKTLSPQWYPYDARFRFTLTLEGEPALVALGSTRKGSRSAQRVGWLRFTIDGIDCRVAATRLTEPGVPDDSLQVFFTDLTSGDETYPLGRYLDLVPSDDDAYVVDLNRAYNPACAYSPFYNCPVPPEENRLAVSITAGEMTPR